MPTTAPTIVHITSCRYSGSTWLNLMLGAHPAMFSVGELDASLKWGRDACVTHGVACPIWGGYRPGAGGFDFRRIAELSERDILVLNNAPRARAAAREAGLAIRDLLLLRDGRAVTASELRKNVGLSMGSAARRWRRRVQGFLRDLPDDPRLTLHYETLCDDTHGQLRRVCGFLGLEPDPRMTDFARSPRCFIGGNLGTHVAAAERNAGDLPAETYRSYDERDGRNWDLAYYRGRDPSPFRDERWRSELGPLRRASFALWAGRLNRRLGYRSSGTIDAT